MAVWQSRSTITPPMWKWAVGETSMGPLARSLPMMRLREVIPGKRCSTSSAPRCEMSSITPPSRGPAAGHDLQVAGPGDHVAGRPFHPFGVVALHEALAFGVVHAGARAPEALFEDGAREHGLSGEETRRVKLEHLHVP